MDDETIFIFIIRSWTEKDLISITRLLVMKRKKINVWLFRKGFSSCTVQRRDLLVGCLLFFCRWFRVQNLSVLRFILVQTSWSNPLLLLRQVQFGINYASLTGRWILFILLPRWHSCLKLWNLPYVIKFIKVSPHFNCSSLWKLLSH